MYFLLVAHGDLRVSTQNIMQGRGAGFLSAGQNEIQAVNFFWLASPHPHESRTARGITQSILRKTGCLMRGPHIVQPDLPPWPAPRTPQRGVPTLTFHPCRQ